MDAMVTSTDGMSKAFKEKDDKYREWTTPETLEKKVVIAVMVPLILSHDGAAHGDTIRLQSFALDTRVDRVRMSQSFCGTML